MIKQDDAKGRVLSRAALFNVIEQQHAVIESLRAELTLKREQPTPSQSEPVGWQFYDEAKWWNGTTDKHKKDTIAGGYPVRDVYTKPQPTSQDVLDAQLYRTLKKLLGYQLSGYDDIGNFFVSKKIRAGEERFLYGEKLDSALTAAMKESK